MKLLDEHPDNHNYGIERMQLCIGAEWRYIFAYYNTVRIGTVNRGLPPSKYRLSKTDQLKAA